MLGLDAAGKTTILYKLHIGEVLSTVPTIGKPLFMENLYKLASRTYTHVCTYMHRLARASDHCTFSGKSCICGPTLLTVGISNNFLPNTFLNHYSKREVC